MTGPTVSVVIPSYNHETYVCDAVDSALDGWSGALEVVVVDDGSTDSSRDRLDRYRDDHRVRLIEQANRGAHDALNRGLKMCTGDFVFILNSDDWFEPQRIPRLVDRLVSDPNASLATSWLRVIDGDGADLGVKRGWHNMPPWNPPTSGPYLSDGGDPRLALLEANWVATTSNLAFRRSLMSDSRLAFLPLRYAHDWDFILSASQLGGIQLVEEPLLRYRVHDANTIREGLDTGRGVMRFEALWVVARHAMRLLHSIGGDRRNRDRLAALFWRSAPTFGRDTILEQLIAIRGDDSEPPSAYDRLLDPENPFRCAAIEALQARP
jgi:glycosyltransferase involved in cell wall biosynthesis